MNLMKAKLEKANSDSERSENEESAAKIEKVIESNQSESEEEVVCEKNENSDKEEN